MNNMKEMPTALRRAGIRPLSPAKADKSAGSTFSLTAPTHTHTHKRIAELRRVKLGNDSGFKADQSMAVYISP